MITEAVFWPVLLSTIVVAAAIIDYRTFTISNKFPMAIAGLFVLYWAISGFSLGILGASLLSAAAAFVVALALYVFRVMGGGDVKLLAALALWFTPVNLLPFFFWIAITGGVIGAGFLLYHMIKIRGLEANTSGEAIQKSALKQRVPYGPAIAAGFILACTVAGV
ncbi:MAG: hypothetical protein HKN14_11205 [Marinicaulis sp.]|nr:prepilin peptidase [Marinicaulis sp.]NNE41470.1 hypothetical protein [Marinicaulis sp.]NNL89713.1 hypothetical protein [Marinicaulis sp.]